MKATDLIKASLEMSQGWIMGMIEDMKDAPLTAPTPNGGNHALWVLGHLAYAEGNLIAVFVEGKENPLADWEGMFGQGSEPAADADSYSSFDELMAKFQQMRANTFNVLSSLSDEDLDKPSHAPEQVKQFFGNIGQCFAALPMHFTFHGGQVADARRAAGRPPMMG